jgi:glutathione-regulated potassium-efflux system ancillary protein KefG
MSKNIIFFAHPNFNESRMNKALIQEATKLKDVKVRDLYSLYGSQKFNSSLDVKEDRSLIEEAEKIILQFPFHWYSSPALLKKWIDDVLAYGWAYATPEPKTKGKKLYIATTMGGRDEDYKPNGYNNYYITDFLTPFIQTAKLCQMEFAGAFFVQGARVITDAELEAKAKEYVNFIELK